MNVKPEELLVEDWIPTYKSGIRILHNQLVQIRSMLFILEHIARFPFDLFGEHPGPFWPLVRRSLETSVVVGLWRILLDPDDKALTLRKLRNQVMSNAIDEAALRRIADELRLHDVDTRIKQFEPRLVAFAIGISLTSRRRKLSQRIRRLRLRTCRNLPRPPTTS